MKKPRVLIFGNVTQKPFVNNFEPLVRAFRRATDLTIVEPYLMPGFLPTGGAAPAPIPLELVTPHAGLAPELVLCMGGGLFLSEEGRAVLGDCVTAGLALSDPLGLTASLAIAPKFDIYYTHDPNSVAGYRASGIDVKFFAPASDPELYAPTGEAQDTDLLFYGKYTPWRDELLSRLASRMTVAVHTYAAETRWSLPTRPPLDDPQSLRSALSRARIALEFAVIEDCGVYTGKHRITNRPQIAACCETVSLIEDFADLRDYFEPGVEIETFRDEAELEQKIDSLLADEKRRVEIGKRARRRISRDQLTDHRVEQVLREVAEFRRVRRGGFFSRLFR